MKCATLQQDITEPKQMIHRRILVQTVETFLLWFLDMTRTAFKKSK